MTILALILALGGCGDGGGSSDATPLVAAPAPTSSATPVPSPTPTPSATPTPTPTPLASPTPTPSLSGRATILSEGDSISVFWGGNHTGIYAAKHPNVTFYGKAVGGSQITNSGNDLTGRLAADLALKPDLVTVLIGANDLTGYPTGQAWLDALWSYVAQVKQSGARVAVGTVLPQCLPDPRYAAFNANFNARRAEVNAALRASVGTRIDAVIDFAADPTIGPDSAACDRSLYQDGLHPTDGGPDFTGGQGALARVYTAAVDRLIR